MGHPYEVDDKDHELQLAMLTIQIHNRAIRILNERGLRNPHTQRW